MGSQSEPHCRSANAAYSDQFRRPLAQNLGRHVDGLATDTDCLAGLVAGLPSIGGSGFRKIFLNPFLFFSPTFLGFVLTFPRLLVIQFTRSSAYHCKLGRCKVPAMLVERENVSDWIGNHDVPRVGLNAGLLASKPSAASIENPDGPSVAQRREVVIGSLSALVPGAEARQAQASGFAI